jgi:hypothetical protein
LGSAKVAVRMVVPFWAQLGIGPARNTRQPSAKDTVRLSIFSPSAIAVER